MNSVKDVPAQTEGCNDKTKLIGERLAGTKVHDIIYSPIYNQKYSSDTYLEKRKVSRGSLFEVVSNKIESARKGSRPFRDISLGFCSNKKQNGAMRSSKLRQKRRKSEIEHKLNKKSYQRFESSNGGQQKDGCKWTFVFDPSGRFAYWWSAVVSIAFIYNFWIIIYRFAFEEINRQNIALWFTLDYCADFLYILDIVFRFRTGYLEDGVLQTDGVKLRLHYMNSTIFYIDCLCLLPLDFLYLSIGFKSMLRFFRLVKIYRFWEFLDRTERHTNYPNVIRTVTLLHYLIAIYHWNACVMYTFITYLDNGNWNFPRQENDIFTIYLHSLYFSTLTLTTIGDLPQPTVKGEYIFVIIQFIFGLLLFSAVLGHVANIVASISFARKDFQAKLDSVKTYMTLRRVPVRLQDRVIKWFDYLWLGKKASDEEKTLNLLPDKLKAEIALHVHLDTLKRVEIFQNTEAGFLCELVLKLRPVLFSPGDFICTKGEVGKEMYIVSKGRLQVVSDGGKTVLATLRPGSYFGEISILNMGNEGNRRTASVRSVGYSDLFVLAKKDLWDVLKDYPAARVRLEAIAVKRLEKYKKIPMEKITTITRCKSTPGLIESSYKKEADKLNLMRVDEGSSCTPQINNSYASQSALAANHSDGEGSSSIHDVNGSMTNGLKCTSTDLTHSITVSSLNSSTSEHSLKVLNPESVARNAELSPQFRNNSSNLQVLYSRKPSVVYNDINVHNNQNLNLMNECVKIENQQSSIYANIPNEETSLSLHEECLLSTGSNGAPIISSDIAGNPCACTLTSLPTNLQLTHTQDKHLEIASLQQKINLLEEENLKFRMLLKHSERKRNRFQDIAQHSCHSDGSVEENSFEDCDKQARESII